MSDQKRFIPLSKQSKRKQRAYHAAKRWTWGALKPVTRFAPDPHRYDRAREKDRLRKGGEDT